MKRIGLWNMVCLVVITCCSVSLLASSHILTPLKYTAEPTTKENEMDMEETIKIKPTEELNSACYSGGFDKRLKNREYYNGVLNYLCDEFGENGVKIQLMRAPKNKESNMVLARTSGMLGMVFYYDNLNDYNTSELEIAHTVFHEYIHLLMFRRMSNAYTIKMKSRELIDRVSSQYPDITKADLYPTSYAETNSSEQIAEILGVYLAIKTKFIKEDEHIGNVFVLTSGFQRDLYEQFLYNIS